MTAMPAVVDVVVVGGGVIGASCLHALASLGMRGCLIERLGLAAGASSACQSGIGYGLNMSERETVYHRAAMLAYRRLAEDGADIDYVRNGGLVIGDPGDEATLLAGVEPLRAAGFDAAWLDGPALREAEPRLSPEIAGAVRFADLATVSPMKVVSELVRRAGRLGAQTCTETELTGIELTGDKMSGVTTNRGRIATPWLVIAAGSWSRGAAALAQLDLPVWPLKGHVAVTEPVSGFIRHYLSENRYAATVAAMRATPVGPEGPTVGGPSAVASVVQPLPSGSFLLGSSREFAGFDRAVNRGRIGEIATRARGLVPALGGIRILRTYAGLRPWSPDGRPLIGRTGHVEGIAIASGHAGDGNTGALITGSLLAADLTGQPPELDATPYSPDRFDLRGRGAAGRSEPSPQERQ